MKVGEKGQIVIPAKARKIMGIDPGDQLVILGDEGQGLAIMKTEILLQFSENVREQSGISKTIPDENP